MGKTVVGYRQEAQKNYTGKTIKENRVKRDLSQKDMITALSEDNGVSICISTLSKIEQGKRMVNDFEIRAICKVFGIPIDDLFNRAGT